MWWYVGWYVGGICVLALYLNFGWAIGTYYLHNIVETKREGFTCMQRILAGWRNVTCIRGGDTICYNNPTSFILTVWSIVWLSILAITSISWIVGGIYYLLKLIFAGGIAKWFEVG